MFLVDKYYHDSNTITCHKDIINKLLDTFDSHIPIYQDLNGLKNLDRENFGRSYE